MAIGASLGGLLADRIRRRSVFALTLLIYGVATGASALSTGLAMLIALRFVVGLGLGAELPVASTLMSEFAPARIRGRVIVRSEERRVGKEGGGRRAADRTRQERTGR